MSRVPTEKQYRLLRVLGNGCALVVGTRRTVEPLLRHGWVTAERDGFSWVRITPAGLHALADAVERYDLPELLPAHNGASQRVPSRHEAAAA